MQIWLDIALVVMIALSVFWGVRRGAVRTLVVLFGSIAAYALASFLSSSLARGIYAAFFQKNVTTSIGSAITEGVGDESLNAVDSVWNSLPDMIVTALQNLGFSTGAESAITGAQQSGSVTEGVIAQTAGTVETLVAPLFITLISLALTIVLFSLFMIGVRFLARALNGVSRVPVIRQINALGGGVIGLLQGILTVLILTTILGLFLPFMIEDYGLFKETVIDQTVLFKLIYGADQFTAPFSAGLG